jgi:flagellin-specific chaperone FliS
MNPTIAYQQQQTLGLTRIDMLLALIDGAIDRVERASAALARNDRAAASVLLLRTQRIVTELIAGLDFQYGQIPRNLYDLYSFVLRSIGLAGPADLNAALQVLRVIREGFCGIRGEAVQLERSGAIPSVEQVHAIQAIA